MHFYITSACVRSMHGIKKLQYINFFGPVHRMGTNASIKYSDGYKDDTRPLSFVFVVIFELLYGKLPKPPRGSQITGRPLKFGKL